MSQLTISYNNIMSLQNLISTLDDNKQNISEGLYLSLCNSLKELHEAGEGMYLVQYYEYGPRPCEDQLCFLTLKTKIMYRGYDSFSEPLEERRAGVQWRKNLLPLNENGIIPPPGSIFEACEEDVLIVIQNCYPFHSIEGQQAMQRYRQDHCNGFQGFFFI